MLTFSLRESTLTVPFGLHVLMEKLKTGVHLKPITPVSKDNDKQK